MPKKHIVRMAVKAAEKSEHRFRLGAVLYKGSRVLSFGTNKAKKTHPRSKHPYGAVHAELDAIIGFRPSELEGCSLYVHRLLKSGKPGLAKPCQYCRELLTELGIEDVHWSKET